MEEKYDFTPVEQPEAPPITDEILAGNITYWELAHDDAQRAAAYASRQLSALYQERSVRQISERSKLRE